MAAAFDDTGKLGARIVTRASAEIIRDTRSPCATRRSGAWRTALRYDLPGRSSGERKRGKRIERRLATPSKNRYGILFPRQDARTHLIDVAFGKE